MVAPGQKIEGFPFDVSDRVAFQSVADRILRDWGVPGLLMNNAAFLVHGGPGGIADPLDNWRRLFDVNLFGVLNGVAAFLPAMLAADAPIRIVNTGSKQGITHPPGNPAYNTVKAALNGYTMNLARDLTRPRRRQGLGPSARSRLDHDRRQAPQAGRLDRRPGRHLPVHPSRGRRFLHHLPGRRDDERDGPQAHPLAGARHDREPSGPQPLARGLREAFAEFLSKPLP